MINVVQVQGLSPDKLAEIAAHLVTSFGNAVTARQTQIDAKYQRWLDNYNAKPAQEVRSTPFANASNFMPQLIRMHTDILTARMIGILYGTRPFWRPTSFLSNVDADSLNALGAWMQYVTFNKMNMYPTVDTLVNESFKIGTVVLKTWWDERTKFCVTGSDDQGKPIETKVDEKDCRIDTVPFEDFYPYPITAKRLEFCTMKFHRLRMTKDEVEYRKAVNLWNKDACDLLLTSRNNVGGSSAQQNEAIRTGINLTPDVGRPYDAIECHFDYQLTPGKSYPLVAVFNPKFTSADSILRLYYKPGSNPFADPFTDFRAMPKSNSFYGDCIPQILEDSQEEQAQIHNARRDSNKIANVPGWKKKRYSDVSNPSTEWFPGKVFEVDNMDDIAVLEFGGNYNSMVEEENFLLSLAERYTGVSPAMQGGGAGVNGKRGSYASQGTMALISEGNRRIDVYLRRMRMPFNDIGNKTYTSYRDFGDPNDWSKYGANGQKLVQLFSTDGQLTGGNTFFELSASDAGANRETDRSALLLMGNTMSAYYHELASTAQTVAQAPDGSPFKELMLQILDGARDLANRILFAFDIGDREKLLPDMRKLLNPGQTDPSGSQQGAGASLQPGLPQPETTPNVGGVQDLSQQLTALTSGLRQGPPQQGPNPGARPIQ